MDKYTQLCADVDLVILDYMLTGIDGWERLNEMLRINPKRKVVVATGYSMKREREERVSQLSKAFIKKPFRVKELTTSIGKILDSN